jgi:hypothetical protein
MPLPAIIALAAKLLPFATAIPDVIRAFGGEKQADAAEKIVGVAKAISGKDDPSEAVEAIIKDPALQLELQKVLSAERLEFARIASESEKHASGQVTERWRFDMTSDSWLSKNVRPLTLVYWTVAITVLVVLDSVLESFEVRPAWIELIETSYTIVLAAYFVGRTVQHLGSMRKPPAA